MYTYTYNVEYFFILKMSANVPCARERLNLGNGSH